MPTRRVVLALVIAACGSQRAELARQPPVIKASPATDDRSPEGQLDDRAFPTSYELALDVDPSAAGFSGEVAITVTATRLQRVIWMHGRDLVIDRATITTADGVTQTARVVADDRTSHIHGQGELLGIGVDEPVVGRLLVHIAYHAKYREKDGMMRAATQAKLVFTDLEPNDARGLMPCFDDPRFKVPWTVSVTAPDGMGVYANYPETKRTKVENGRVRVAFQPTRPLPSYLIAVAVGELEVVPVATVDAVPIQLLLPGKGLAPHTQVIQEATPLLLAELVRVFREPVPFPKLDMLVIPMDPGRGGMENPGLTTLGAHMVLVDPALPPERAWPRIEDAVHVVAHELAHLWIGDLITIGNWGDLWLQEGGATWFGIRAARTYLGPKWVPPFNRDVIDQRAKGGGRPPIRMQIGNLTDANALFRTETYAGGAAVFDALEAWFGEEAITQAVADLIDSKAANTVTLDDFMAAVRGRAPVKPDDLEDALVGILDATKMPTVSVTCRSGTIEVTVDTNTPVPVCLDRDGGTRSCAVVRDGHATLTRVSMCPRWMLLNPGGGAPYSRAWAPDTLAPLLELATLGPRDVAAVQSELRVLLITNKLGTLSLGDQITAAAWMASSEDSAPMVVWRAVEVLDDLERVAPDEPARRALLARVQAITARRIPRFLVAPGKDSVTAPLAGWLARRGDPAAKLAAAGYIEDLVKAATTSGGNAEAINARAAASDVKRFKSLRTVVVSQSSRSPVLLRALASFQFPKVADELRSLVKNPTLTPRDVEIVLREAIRNPALRSALASLATLRSDVSISVRAAIGRALCDDAAATTIADTFHGDVAASEKKRLLDDAVSCMARRKAWDLK